ncbi:MAG: penicillin acylase family protein [Planctomycetes bacterium]|nr:penicillin acylase family protein [Planctomycetota bacterium]
MKRIETRHARRPFEAVRDENGVPRVEADSFRTALYALGFLHALDRPTQLLFARTIAQGTAAAQIKDRQRLRDTDRFFRRAGLYLRLEEEVRLLDDETFELLTVYCEGVNDGLKDSGRSLAMWATGFHPEPWNQQAVMLVGNLLSFGGLAVGQQQNERLLLELIQLGIDDERLHELFAPLLDDADMALLRQVKVPHQISDEALELISDLPRLAGSNAWAVSPRRSASGGALLACDPHLEVNRLPAIWYEASLRWGDDYVMGASLPGCPLFAVARTPRLAWGVTYLKGDTSDLFIEDCRAGGDTGWQYRRGNTWHDFRLRVEEIHHKDGSGETLRIYSNDVGTLEGNLDEAGPGLHLSVAWTGHSQGTGAAIGTWLKVIPCRGAAEGMEVVRRSPQPTLNWLFADREGHIGMQTSGWFPRRPHGYSGALPIPAWDEGNHWQGWLPETVLPRVYDPPEGFVASANENVNTPGGPRLVTLPVPEYRKRRIVERLRELPQATLDDMQKLQYDVLSTQARDLLTVFLPQLTDGPIKQRLSDWDLRYTAESYEATLFQRLYRNVILETFGESRVRDGGLGWRRVLYLCSRVGYSTMVLTAVDRVLMKERSSWWRGRDKGELIRRAAARLDLEPEQTWGEFNSFRMTNRYFEQARGGRMLGFKSGELPMPGCHATPFQGHLLRAANREETFAPSYHFVTDLTVDEAWTNLPGGPSESRFSKYYRSDVARWFAGEYKRIAPAT